MNNNWTETNVEELSKNLVEAMSPAITDPDRFGMDSPDSGIHVNSFEYGFNDALLGLDDPIFGDISNIPSLGTSVEAIPVHQSEIISDFTVTNEVFKEEPLEDLEEMEELEDMDEEEEEEEEDEDNVSNYSDDENVTRSKANIPKNHPVEIHSYSVIKVKKETNFKAKSKRSAAPSTASMRKQTSAGRKYKESVSQKKRKLYEMEPLGDPVAEKNRLNALNAKKNRDKKKQQLAEAESEISRLREENEELRTEAEEARDELDAARRELAELKALMKLQSGGRHSSIGKARAPISSA